MKQILKWKRWKKKHNKFHHKIIVQSDTKLEVFYLLCRLCLTAGKEQAMSLIDNEHQLPEGLGMRLGMDMEAMKSFANLSDQEKNELVGYIKGSTTGDEAKNRVTEVVRNLHSGGSFR
jgi:hypothetical protein